MTTQRKLNSAPALRDPPNIARDGGPKLTQTEFAPAHGMRSRTAEHNLMPGFSNPLDDQKELPLKEGHKGKPAPIHPGTPSRANRGVHVEGRAQAVLNEAANLGRPQPEGKVINSRDNGRTADGGSAPVTTKD
jgi:hypothetical protein